MVALTNRCSLAHIGCMQHIENALAKAEGIGKNVIQCVCSLTGKHRVLIFDNYLKALSLAPCVKEMQHIKDSPLKLNNRHKSKQNHFSGTMLNSIASVQPGAACEIHAAKFTGLSGSSYVSLTDELVSRLQE